MPFKPDKGVPLNDIEIKYAILDRAATIGKCDYAPIYPIYKNNENSNNNNVKLWFFELIIKYDKWFENSNNMQNMSTLIKNIMLSKETNNLNEINFLQSDIKHDCQGLLEQIIQECEEDHLPYLLGMFYWNADYNKIKNNVDNNENEINNQLIKMNPNNYKISKNKLLDAKDFFKKNTIRYAMTNFNNENKQLTYYIPNFYCTISVIRRLCREFHLPHIDNGNRKGITDDNNKQTINIDKIYHTGYQSIAQIRCAIFYTFELYKHQCWQLLSERNNKCLFNSKKIFNLQCLEIDCAKLLSYLRNQKVDSIGQKGSMRNEFVHYYCNIAQLQRGLKNCVTTYKLCKIIPLSFNYNHMKSLMENDKYKKYHCRFTQNELNTMQRIINTILKIQSVNLITNNNNKGIVRNNINVVNMSYESHVKTLAKEWLFDEQVQPNEAKWDNKIHNSLLTTIIYIYDGKLLSSAKNNIMSYFRNAFTWEEIVWRAMKMKKYLDNNPNHPIYTQIRKNQKKKTKKMHKHQ